MNRLLVYMTTALFAASFGPGFSSADECPLLEDNQGNCIPPNDLCVLDWIEDPDNLCYTFDGIFTDWARTPDDPDSFFIAEWVKVTVGFQEHTIPGVGLSSGCDVYGEIVDACEGIDQVIHEMGYLEVSSIPTFVCGEWARFTVWITEGESATAQQVNVFLAPSTGC